MLRKLESLEIKDGKIILKVRAKPGGAAPSQQAKAAAPVEAVPSGNGQPKTEPSEERNTETKGGSPNRLRPSRRSRSHNVTPAAPAHAASRGMLALFEHQPEELR